MGCVTSRTLHLSDRGHFVSSAGDLLHVVTNDSISAGRKAFGRAIIWGSGLLMLVIAAAQLLQVTGGADFGFQNWRPTLYAYVFWAICLCWGQVLQHGEHGKRTLFVLPAALFVISLTVFPLLFGLIIAFSDWNLSSPNGRQFNGLERVGHRGWVIGKDFVCTRDSQADV